MLVQEPPQGKRVGAVVQPVSAGPTTSVRGMADLAALRLILSGESVVDLAHAWFSDRDSVDDFLRLCEFDTDNPLDLGRLTEIHREATLYLSEANRFRLPREVEEPAEIHEIFLLASSGQGKVQRFACMTLKIMHILHHLAGRELLFNTPISEAALFDRLGAKVFTTIDRMRASGIAVQEFAASKKTRTSLVTKLLAKRSTLASQIFDKLRFRITLGTRDDLVSALVYLSRNLFPFNYAVPEQSQNDVIQPEDVARVLNLTPEIVQRFWNRGVEPPRDAVPVNEFSGPTYRSLNFVADVPLRIDDVAPEAAPAISFVQAEFQLVDADTDRANNRGDNAHAQYKERQLERVRKRLERDDDTDL